METFIYYSIILLWVLQPFILFALFLLFRQFGIVFLKTGEAVSRDGIPLGKKVPKEPLSLTGKQTVIVFISPECGPCRELLLEWNDVVKRYQKRIRFMLIVQGGPEKAVELLQDRKLAGEILGDSEQEYLKAFQVRVTPFGFAMDEDGIVRAKGLCGGSAHLERLISYLEEQTFQEVFLTSSKK